MLTENKNSVRSFVHQAGAHWSKAKLINTKQNCKIWKGKERGVIHIWGGGGGVANLYNVTVKPEGVLHVVGHKGSLFP